MESKTKHKTKTNKQKKKKYPHLPTFQSFQMFYCTFEKKKNNEANSVFSAKSGR